MRHASSNPPWCRRGQVVDVLLIPKAIVRTIAVDHAGKVMFPRTITRLEILDFHEAPADQFLREFIEEIADRLPKTSSAALVSTLFRRSLASSPPALEESVRRLRNRLAPGFLAPAPSGSDGDDREDVNSLPSAIPEDAELIAALNECLAEIDRSPGDSKFEIFLAKIMEKRSDNSAPFSLAVVTQYRATLFYLQAQLEELGFKTNILHGGMTFDERMQSVDRFKQEGGVLIATAATMTEGINLSQVEKLVLYDLSTSKLKLEQIYGRFQQFGRTVPLKLSVLYNLDDTDGATAQSLDKLREIVATE